MGSGGRCTRRNEPTFKGISLSTHGRRNLPVHKQKLGSGFREKEMNPQTKVKGKKKIHLGKNSVVRDFHLVFFIFTHHLNVL